MALVLYNTFSKREEEFAPVNGTAVSMYTCGPTVYGRPHVGNYSSFLMADLLRRWLEAGHNWTVTHVKNITDVGHLVADRDQGEDKIEKQAREEFGAVSMESVLGIARKYEEQYLEDEAALNMRPPEHRPRATQYIDQMRTMTESLLESGHAYVTDDGIYFSVETFPNYGHLSGNTVENLSAGVRIEVNDQKKHPADFALWKFCIGMNKHHVLRWQSPRGAKGEQYPEGFPGWHIECSAMSGKILGDQIDLHTGGEDNIFPHHECEIAQSESITQKKPFVRLWLHKRRIDLEGEKMSKSLGNVLTVPDVLSKGYSPLDLRFYLLSVHYRTNLKFSWKGMDEAHKSRQKILEWMSDVERWKIELEKIQKSPVESFASTALLRSTQFADALDSDLNVSEALSSVFTLMTESRNAHTAGAIDRDAMKAISFFIDRARHTFGCFEKEEQMIPANVQQLIDARASARASKNFAESDRLRGEIEKEGYLVRDTAKGQDIRKM